MLRKALLVVLLLSLAVAVDFNITSTDDFDAGTSSTTGDLEAAGFADDANLVTYWKLNGDATDETGNHDGTVNGATYTSSGKFDGAYDFDGTDDVIDISSDVGVANSSFTISAWAKRDVSNDRHVIFSIGTNAVREGLILEFDGTTDKLECNFYGDDLAGNTAVTDTDWHHVACTYDASTDSRTVYLDGANDGSDTTGGDTSASGASTIGKLEWNNVGHFDGVIDDVAIFSRELTAAEIFKIYSRGQSNHVVTDTDEYITADQIQLSFPYADKDANLVAYYRLENNATDETGNHDGTVNGATYTSSGKFDGAYDFDGTDDYISIPDDDSLSFGDGSTDEPFSISMWWNMDDATVFRAINKYDSTYNEWTFGTLGTDKIAITLYDTSAGAYLRRYYDTALTSDEGSWHHYVATYDGSSLVTGLKIYRDGIQIDDTTATGGTYTAMENGAKPVEIGRIDLSPTDSLANGKIDEVKIYDRALSATEISTLYNSGNKYVASGDWASASQTMTSGHKLNDITITHSGLDASNYIDRVEWLVGGVSKANYSTDIDSGTSTTITTPTSGSFADVDENFTVRVYLVGNGSSTPVVEEVSGFYEAMPDFLITTTEDFDSGTKSNTTTDTDRYNQSADTLELNFPLAVKDNNLTGYWRLENNANDETGNHNASIGTGSAEPTYTSSGKFDGAYDFDGDDEITSDDNISEITGSQNRTVCAWFKGTTAGGHVVGMGTWSEYDEFGMYLPSDKLQLTGHTCYKQWTWNNNLDGNWHFACIVLDGDSTADAVGYGDGSALSVIATLDATLTTADAPLKIGYRDTGLGWFTGTIDEVKVYDRALSATEVSTLYNSGNKYKLQGNWTSAEQEMTVDHFLSNMTITYSNVDSSNYIDRVEWLVGGVSKANYSTDIDSGTSTTITTPTSGSFADVDDNFTVRVYLVGNGSSTPVVEEVSGFYEEVVAPTLVVWYTDSSYDEFDFNPADWTGGEGTIQETFTGYCGTTVDPAYNYYYSFDINTSKVIDEIRFMDSGSGNYQITAVTLEQ